MDLPKIIVAIDGYSSTGKSTFAKAIASRLGYIHLDTGALYRAVTLFAIENAYINDQNEIDLNRLKKGLKEVSIHFEASGPENRCETYIDNRCVEEKIRSLEVSNKVSYISSIPFVREYVDKILHEAGREKGIVMDGRDIGTAVFPDAEIKIFMTADENVRAMRRLHEMEAAGKSANFEDVLKNVRERDHLDTTRATAPLRRADDAILLDNSDMTPKDQMKWFDRLLENYAKNIAKYCSAEDIKDEN